MKRKLFGFGGALVILLALMVLAGCSPDGDDGGGGNGGTSGLSGTLIISDGGSAITTAEAGTYLNADYSGNENLKYQWNKDGTAITNETSMYFRPMEPGSYTVTVTDYNDSTKSKTSAAVTVTVPATATVSVSVDARDYISSSYTANSFTITLTLSAGIWNFGPYSSNISGSDADKFIGVVSVTGVTVTDYYITSNVTLNSSNPKIVSFSYYHTNNGNNTPNPGSGTVTVTLDSSKLADLVPYATPLALTAGTSTASDSDWTN